LTPFVPKPELVRDLVAEQHPLSVDLLQAVTVRLVVWDAESEEIVATMPEGSAAPG
jgi:hypothetical protein